MTDYAQRLDALEGTPMFEKVIQIGVNHSESCPQFRDQGECSCAPKVAVLSEEIHELEKED